MTREEAIRILASSCIPGSKQTEALETLIPELKESEDERIRKKLIEYFNHYNEDREWWEGITPRNIISYLERQKEQKHILKFKVGDKVHLEGDDVNILTITGIEKDRYLTDNSYGPILFGAEDIWERIEQKPWEWSKEESKILDSIIDDYEKAAKSFCGYDGKIGLLRAIRDGEYDLSKQE